MNQLGRALSAIAALALLAVLAFIGKAWYDSRLPDTYGVMEYGTPDYGGGAVAPPGHVHGRTSVADLVAAPGRADVRFRLTAKEARIRLDSGREIDALTFNGQVPGPELRVRQHDLVEVTLVNEEVDDGVAVHWHGVDVPNSDDGVAGVTQDAVRPGESYTYRFRADQLGTFWYHSHQFSANQVARGLYGPFVIEPRAAPAEELDLSVPVHTFGNRRVFGTSDGLARRPVEAGRPVRLRLINTDDTPREFFLRGAPFRVLAVDGVELTDPEPIEAVKLKLGAGGRYDLGFTMPPSAVTLGELGSKAGIVFGPPAATESPPVEPANEFDPGSYGSPPKLPFTLASRFDREFKVELTRKVGFLNGKPGRHWAINGKLYPDVPMPVVHEGELVKLTFVNHSGKVHPMHLHGHHVLVLSRNGKPVRTPWWVDILDVGSGDTYETGFRATNSGIWMLHCHNLPHAADGLVMHLTYDGVTTPFRVGGHAHNQPE